MPLKLNIFIFSIETKCLKIKCKFKKKKLIKKRLNLLRPYIGDIFFGTIVSFSK